MYVLFVADIQVCPAPTQKKPIKQQHTKQQKTKNKTTSLLRQLPLKL